MNVKLAAQSKSVSDALEFLKTEELYFEDVDATVEFMTYIKNAFNILNSGSKFSIKPYNRPFRLKLLIHTKISLTNLQIYKFQYVGLEFTEYKNDHFVQSY